MEKRLLSAAKDGAAGSGDTIGAKLMSSLTSGHADSRIVREALRQELAVEAANNSSHKMDVSEIKDVVSNARKQETRAAHDALKLKNDKEGLLFTLADLRIKAAQAAVGGLPHNNTVLLEREISRIQKSLDAINKVTPEIDSSEDHAKVSKIIEEWNAGKRDWKKEVVQIGKAEKELAKHPDNRRVQGDENRAKAALFKTEEELARIAHEAELLTRSSQSNPSSDESISNINEPAEHSKPAKAEKAAISTDTHNSETAQETVPEKTTALELVPEMELTNVVIEPITEKIKPEASGIITHATEKHPALSKGALAAIKSADEYGTPTFVSDHLRKTAEANDVHVMATDKAEDILNKLRAKIDPTIEIPAVPEQTHHTKKHGAAHEEQPAKKLTRLAIENMQTQAYENFGLKNGHELATKTPESDSILSQEIPVGEPLLGQDGAFAKFEELARGPKSGISDFEFPEEIKLKLDPVQLELFEKIEAGIVATENNNAARVKQAGFSERMLNHMRFTGKEYSKLSLKTKLLVSVALFGVAWAAGGTIASVAIGGSLIQRGLGGLATFVAAEGAMKASAERGGRERGEWEARRHTGVALITGFLIGGGVLGHAIQNIFHEALPSQENPKPSSDMTALPKEIMDSQISATNKGLDELAEAMKTGDTESASLTEETMGISHDEALKLVEQRAAEKIALVGGAISEVAPTAEEFESAIKAAETMAQENAAEYTATAGSGDSVWKLAHDQLEAHFGEKFDALPKAQQTHLIDAIKDKINADPKHFGITSGDADVLKVGDKIDFKELFADDKLIDSQFEAAKGLATEQMTNIDNYTAEPATVEIPEVHWTEVASPLENTEAGAVNTTETPARTMTTGEAVSYYNPAPTEAHEFTPSDPQVIAYADQQVHDHINTLFGSKGFFGFGAKDGMEATGWKDPEVGFASKTVQEIMAAHPDAFPADGARHFGIESYEETEKMKDYISTAQAETKVEPYQNENVLEYIERAEKINISRFMNKG